MDTATKIKIMELALAAEAQNHGQDNNYKKHYKAMIALIEDNETTYPVKT